MRERMWNERKRERERENEEERKSIMLKMQETTTDRKSGTI